jgi:hypothetical protein
MRDYQVREAFNPPIQTTEEHNQPKQLPQSTGGVSRLVAAAF